ncbi:aminoglycoside 6-adenylyltransferase [Halobacillus litoralis]|uniref:aminoglycoside 6-adenylyltransferase n=1 Tax=Halobacillus litoralis TaxID=45668 RepID=UPI001CD76B2E|nr:aminoglycoside 6-adenylyltransferase [Halobacillus litoralis]MCA1023194.1 aminoglycoside 6-adenylyltransferase [Halobacillus litoralis]
MDFTSFIEDRAWVDVFGERLIMQLPDQYPFLPMSEGPVRKMLHQMMTWSYQGLERLFCILRPIRQVFFIATFLNICGNGIKQPIRGVFILTTGMLFLHLLTMAQLFEALEKEASIHEYFCKSL